MKVSDKVKVIDWSIGVHRNYLQVMNALEMDSGKSLKKQYEAVEKLIDDLKKLKYDICDNG